MRPEHEVNNGKIFAWDHTPLTGHPGEDYGCRCWAEPYVEESAQGLQEVRSQIVTYAASDTFPAWTWEDFANHYFFSKGQPVTLDKIGHLQSIIDCARTYDQIAVGGGTIFNRVADQIIEKARQRRRGSFSDYFQRGYNFQDFVWSIGGATVTTSFSANIAEKDDFLIVVAEIEYIFNDVFTNPLDVGERRRERKDWDIPLSKPYAIVGTWSTHLEEIVRKQ